MGVRCTNSARVLEYLTENVEPFKKVSTSLRKTDVNKYQKKDETP